MVRPASVPCKRDSASLLDLPAVQVVNVFFCEFKRREIPQGKPKRSAFVIADVIADCPQVFVGVFSGDKHLVCIPRRMPVDNCLYVVKRLQQRGGTDDGVVPLALVGAGARALYCQLAS